MELFYIETISSNMNEVKFSGDESRHIIKALRKKNGDPIHITNGKGLEWIGKITNSDIRKVTAKYNSGCIHKNNKPNLHIAIAPPKSNDRMDWFLEKATEIGISEITPIICDHSERKVIKPPRMKKILVSAIKQSNQFHLPKLNPICTFKQFTEKKYLDIKMIAHCREGMKKHLYQINNIQSGLIILIGPEGDFTKREIEIAKVNSYAEISLSSQRLRTETAGIVACNSVATLRKAN
tara:strand:- start:145 stop:855 length:711 start_codon:yes stop_codon:yes gene_type:complete